jgi:peptidoglycan/LPS O-acetylase OafA/YrhL
MRKEHHASLDGLRGVAAAAVVLYHMTYQAFGPDGAAPHRGYLSVDFFFALSGLVISQAYETRFSAGMPFGAFVKIRLIRLYPLILLGVLFGVGSKLFSVHFHHVNRVFLAVPFTMLLLPGPSVFGPDDAMFPLDPPLWSLMFELWANFIFAFVAIRFSTLLRPLIIVAIVFGAVTLAPVAWSQQGLSGGHNLQTFWTGALRVTFAFSTGIGLRWLLTPDRILRLPSIPFPVLGAALMAALAGGARFGPLYDVFAIVIIFPVIVALGIKDCASPRWRSVALKAGALSYPIYVLHDATLAHFTHFKGHSIFVTVAAFIVAFAAIVLISDIALRWYDEPLRRWLSRRVLRPFVSPAVLAEAKPE